ncbi:DNA gyrase C-terminal beta-propeller domain-containing protein, partial [Escherichia coli]|uniref:DNA gyrase C-terminal beta-propeller domain-containing protein n=1 Tax=Escherichia coli TaxID=562 RepID=UPI003D33518B
SSRGRVYSMKVYQLPEATRGARGRPIVNLLPLDVLLGKTPKMTRDVQTLKAKGDALALQRNSSLQLDYATVNPHTFAEPTSQHIISAQEGRPIESLVM